MAGDYARCAQLASLDAGFDPRGVDGAPGAGARAALVAWAEADGGVQLPSFTRKNAAQICHYMKAPQQRFDGPLNGVATRLWPIWSDSVFYNENTVFVTMVQGDGQVNGAPVLQQALWFTFPEPVRFGGQNNNDLDLPWSPLGTIKLHGQSDIDGIGRIGLAHQASDMAVDMLRLIDTPLAGTGINSLTQMAGSRVKFMRRALGAQMHSERDWINPRNPEWQVLRSVVDHVDGRDIVAADFMIHHSEADRRIIMFMAFDPDGNDDQLLYAAAPPALPTQATSPYPAVGDEAYVAGLVNADCDAFTPAERSSAVAEFDGFQGHPARLCVNNAIAAPFMVWTKTNADGTSLSATVTDQGGNTIPIANSYYREADGSNVFELALDINGTSMVCPVIKPSGGIAVFGEVVCQ